MPICKFLPSLPQTFSQIYCSLILNPKSKNAKNVFSKCPVAYCIQAGCNGSNTSRSCKTCIEKVNTYSTIHKDG